MYIYTHIYIYTNIYTYIYIYTYHICILYILIVVNASNYKQSLICEHFSIETGDFNHTRPETGPHRWTRHPVPQDVDTWIYHGILWDNWDQIGVGNWKDPYPVGSTTKS